MTGDISERIGYDFEQLKSIAKVQVRQTMRLLAHAGWLICQQFATLLHVAGFDYDECHVADEREHWE
jgi:hypothetical protein